MANSVSKIRYQRAAIARSLTSASADAPIQMIVLDQNIEASLSAFEAADTEAQRSQWRFRRSGRTALWATTVGTLIGALLLLPLDSWIGGFPRSAIGQLQTLSLITTFLAVQWIGWQRPVDAWMTNRAEAERLRGDLFQAIMNATPPIATDAKNLSRQKLTVLMDSYINDQLAYYDNTARKHARAARRMTPFRLAGYLLTVAAVVLGGLATLNVLLSFGIPVPSWFSAATDGLTLIDTSRWQLGFGTMASSLLAHASARSMMDQDDRNAVLYARTAAHVREFLAKRLPALEASLDDGNQMELQLFFGDARRLLEVEHVAWFLSRPSSDPRQTPDHRVAGARR